MNTSMTNPVHPGKIVFWNGDTNEIVRTAEVSELPEEMSFAPTDQGLVPVTKVIATTAGDRRFIREYGPDGQLLRSTTQIKQ